MATVHSDCRSGELVVFPETAVSGYDDELCRRAMAVPGHGGSPASVYLTYAVNPVQLAGVWHSRLISAGRRRISGSSSPEMAGARVGRCAGIMISPSGRALAELAAGGAVLKATIDTNDISNWYLGQRRTDVLDLRYHGR